VFLPPQQRTAEFITRLFNAFDSNKSGEVDFREFTMAMNYSTSENPEEKVSFYFKTLDIDNSGFLEEKELLYAVELIFKVRHHLKRVKTEHCVGWRLLTAILPSLQSESNLTLVFCFSPTSSQ
jgi:Ca2+-binding EF-hand superfamily protein